MKKLMPVLSRTVGETCLRVLTASLRQLLFSSFMALIHERAYCLCIGSRARVSPHWRILTRFSSGLFVKYLSNCLTTASPSMAFAPSNAIVTTSLCLHFIDSKSYASEDYTSRFRNKR